jgi:hypothetical protein
MHLPNFNKPAVESVAGYAKDKNPAAATFNKGARTVAEIAEAAEARRQHGRAVQDRFTGPRGPHGHDAGK